MIKNFLTVIVSLLLTVIVIETYLIFFGPFNHLTTSKLEPSGSIYERPKNFKQKQPHPDLKHTVENYFDEDGVKNYSSTNTSKKKNILGFFGDSMTENINIPKEFEYTNLLNSKLKDYNAVNYGIGGYNLEQAFIRYLNYQNHDIKYVFYYMMPGDHIERGLIGFDNEGKYFINRPKINKFFSLLGNLNITFLVIDVYFTYNVIFNNYHQPGKDNYASLYANKIYSELYASKGTNSENFVETLKLFNSLVNDANKEFILLLYPNKKLINFVKSQMKDELDKMKVYVLNDKLKKSEFRFVNDGHWNEYGQIEYVKNLLTIFDELNIQYSNDNFEKQKINIDRFYRDNKHR